MADPDETNEHYDGKRFYNVPDRPHPGIGDGLKFLFSADRGEWDEPRDDIEPGPPPPKRVGPGELRVTFVNHATVLIQIDGLNLITDPVYGKRASPVPFAGPRRVRPPGIRFDDLPPIDAVLLSHDHYDHLCVETLTRLHERDQMPVYTGLGNAELLEDEGIAVVHELDWWQGRSLGKNVELNFVPAQHFSNRGLHDRYETLWGGFVIEGTEATVYFAGDTGDGPHFEEIADRFEAIDLALLPIGAYRPRYMMEAIHISPAEAVAAHQRLGARQSMAIHFGTFPLASDGQHEPVELLDRALTAEKLTRNEFWVLEHGEGRDVHGPNR